MPPGWGRVPYHSSTVPRVPWYPGYPPPCTTPPSSVLLRHRSSAAQEWRPGLKPALFLRVGCEQKCACTLLFSHLRSISPGHPDYPRVVWRKCWIASRSNLPWLAWPARAWPGHPKPHRLGFSEVYPSLSRIRTSKTRKSRIRHQTKRRVFLPFLTNRQNPENSTFWPDPGSRPHSNQRAEESGSCRIPALFGRFPGCGQNPVFPGFREILIQRVG